MKLKILAFAFSVLFASLGLLTGCSTSDDGGSAAQQVDSTPRMVSTIDSNSCQVWDAEPSDIGAEVSWSGGCAGGVAQGAGTLTYYNATTSGTAQSNVILKESGTLTAGKLNGPVLVNYNNPYSSCPPYQALFCPVTVVGKLDFVDGNVQGPGDIKETFPGNAVGISLLYLEADGEVAPIRKIGNFVGPVGEPAVTGDCEVSIEFQQEEPVFKGTCDSGWTADGTLTKYTGNGIRAITYAGEFNTAVNGTDANTGLQIGVRTVYDSSGTSIIEQDTGTFSRNDQDFLDEGSSRFYNQDGSLKEIQVGSATTTENNQYMSDVYLDGPGAYAGPDGKLIKGTWVMGCFDGKYPQEGISSCSDAASDVQSDENQLAQAQAQQEANQAYQAQQDQIAQAEQDAAAQDEQNLMGQIQNSVSRTQQIVATGVQTVEQTHEQVQQDLASRDQLPTATGSEAPPPPIVPPVNQQVASNDSGSSAPSTATPVEQCVGNFYNSGMYGWWTWTDTCSFPITIAAELRNSPGSEGGVSTVYPGNSSNSSNGSSGLSADEVNQGGGWVYAACPQGYVPYDSATNQIYGKNSASYYCKAGYVQ